MRRAHEGSNKRERGREVKQCGWSFNTTRTIRKLAGGWSRRNDRDRVEVKEGKKEKENSRDI